MNERDHERMCEDAAKGAACTAYLREILDAQGSTNIGSLHRGVYKFTECGASLAFRIDGKGWVYDPWEVEESDCVTALGLSSIVEGVDACTDFHVVDFLDEEIEDYPRAFNDALEQVEEEARNIWNETHGCEECARHFGEEGPVWSECPACFGEGQVV